MPVLREGYPKNGIKIRENLEDAMSEPMSEDRCPYCDASLRKHWHRIVPGLVSALVEAYRVVSKKGENHFAKAELELTHAEYGSFQKLRFHALIAKYKDEDGRVVFGEWLITKRGGDFLKGKVAIPVSVQTFRNRVVDHDERLVFIRDVIKDPQYWQKHGEFDFDVAEFKEDENGQGRFI